MSLSPEGVRPRFIYDQAFDQGKPKYRILVDEEAIVTSFRLARVPDNQIKSTTVVFFKELPEDSNDGDYAGYDFENRTLRLYVDPFWHEYNKCLVLADLVIKGNGAVKPVDFHYLLRGDTDRVIDYLALAPKKRARVFIDKLLFRAMQREINLALLHEIQHARDHFWVSRLGFLEDIFEAIHLWDFWYAKDPLERRAERFADRMISKTMQKPLVAISRII